MAKTLVHRNLGPPGTPQEVKDLRNQNYDLHEEIGYPVIFKHKWNLQDEREGRARQCPFHDELYDQSPRDCPYCFGTGYVGGFADGQIVYMSIQDTPADVIRLTPQGLLQMDQHPQVSAPWLPEMGDGDLVILAEFNPRTWEVIDVAERYTLRQVNPVTLRGPGWSRMSSTTSKRQRVSQESQADKLPYGHEWYDVPITFPYDEVPEDPTPPGDVDPPVVGTYTATDRVVRVRGAESAQRETSHAVVAKVQVAGDNTTATYSVRLNGKASGTTIVNL